MLCLDSEELMAMVRDNVSVHLSDHSEIDMADKGNHTDVTNGLGSANLIIVRVLVLNWKTTLIWELEDIRIVFDVVIGIAIYFWAFKNTITQSNQEFLKTTQIYVGSRLLL